MFRKILDSYKKLDKLKRRADYLNELKIDHLVYRNSLGTIVKSTSVLEMGTETEQGTVLFTPLEKK